MKNLRQLLLAAKIEYHWWRINSLRKYGKGKNVATINLHRYKAERAMIEYEVSLGLRDYCGFWKY